MADIIKSSPPRTLDPTVRLELSLAESLETGFGPSANGPWLDPGG